MKRLILACACAVLAACGPSADETTSDDAAGVEESELNLNIGMQGAGGIATALPMTLEAVSAAATGYIVAEAEEGGARIITLSNAEGVVFTLRATPDGAHVREIVTRSPQARGPYWEVVGQTLLSHVAGAQQAVCQLEPSGSDADFICSSSQDAMFWRAFKLPSWYHDARSPFEAIHNDAKYDAVLVEMRWRAPPP